MHGELIQFNSGDHVLGNKNVTEAVITDGDIVFNESYVVIGESLEAKNIHATYDLDVVANIVAVTISVNGNLFVKGDIEADEVICRGSFYCTGEARVKKCNLGSNALIGSVIGKEVYAAGDLFIKSTIDTDESLEADGLVVAGEGIMGNGLFKAKAAIANEYFEFSGRNTSKVFEISEMQFTESSDTEDIDNVHVEPDTLDIESAVEVFNKVFNKSIDEWNQFEEEKFIIEVRKVAESMYDLQMIDRVVDTVIALSYERQIENFKRCRSCYVELKQMRQIYFCKCGFATDKHPVYCRTCKSSDSIYWSGKLNDYNFRCKKCGNKIPMFKKCDQCGTKLSPKIALDPSQYFAYSIGIIKRIPGYRATCSTELL